MHHPIGTNRPGGEGAIVVHVKKFTVTIEGPGWQDLEEVELPELPSEGDTIETRYGTCFVTGGELLPDTGEHAGKIVARLP